MHETAASVSSRRRVAHSRAGRCRPRGARPGGGRRSRARASSQPFAGSGHRCCVRSARSRVHARERRGPRGGGRREQGIALARHDPIGRARLPDGGPRRSLGSDRGRGGFSRPLGERARDRGRAWRSRQQRGVVDAGARRPRVHERRDHDPDSPRRRHRLRQFQQRASPGEEAEPARRRRCLHRGQTLSEGELVSRYGETAARRRRRVLRQDQGDAGLEGRRRIRGGRARRGVHRGLGPRRGGAAGRRVPRRRRRRDPDPQQEEHVGRDRRLHERMGGPAAGRDRPDQVLCDADRQVPRPRGQHGDLGEPVDPELDRGDADDGAPDLPRSVARERGEPARADLRGVSPPRRRRAPSGREALSAGRRARGERDHPRGRAGHGPRSAHRGAAESAPQGCGQVDPPDPGRRLQQDRREGHHRRARLPEGASRSRQLHDRRQRRVRGDRRAVLALQGARGRARHDRRQLRRPRSTSRTS